MLEEGLEPPWPQDVNLLLRHLSYSSMAAVLPLHYPRRLRMGVGVEPNSRLIKLSMVGPEDFATSLSVLQTEVLLLDDSPKFLMVEPVVSQPHTRSCKDRALLFMLWPHNWNGRRDLNPQIRLLTLSRVKVWWRCHLSTAAFLNSNYSLKEQTDSIKKFQIVNIFWYPVGILQSYFNIENVVSCF